MIAVKQNILQAGERVPSPAQQAAMYDQVVRREATKLAEHYIKLCEESNNTFPNYRQVCYIAAKTEVEARYE